MAELIDLGRVQVDFTMEPEPYRPCAGCDAVGESCRAVGCPAVTTIEGDS